MKNFRPINNNLVFRLVIIFLIFLSMGVFIWAGFLYQKPLPKPVPSPETLGETRTAVIVSPIPKATQLPTPSIKPSPRISPKPSPDKPFYIIAAFGDSMVDTMGENLDYLDKSMMARYPKTKFKFYNYGIGSQNVIEANKRFEKPFEFKTRNYQPINQINADVIIISSFAYNPSSPFDLKSYLKNLKELLDKAKKTGARVYLLVDIAPLKTGFGKGVGGVNWSEDKVKTHVGYILQNLDGAMDLAPKTGTPLINAYKESQVEGKYGNKTYVGSHDGIHPSIEGEVFMAELIAETLELP